MTDIVRAPSTGWTRPRAATWLSKLVGYIRRRRRHRASSIEALPVHLQRDIGLDQRHRRLKDLPYY